MIHPGYNLLAEGWADMADEPLAIVRATAQGLGLPLRSLEIELGPSQVEAVFDPSDALTAADRMVLFRNGVRQALRRAGYHASFVCRPPFPNVMASGWHLHQSLVDAASGANAFVRAAPPRGSDASDALHTLSDVGAQYLAGLLAHGRAMAPFCVPTVNAYARFRPNAMAPQSVLWGRDNRGAMRCSAAGASAHRGPDRRAGASPTLHCRADPRWILDGRHADWRRASGGGVARGRRRNRRPFPSLGEGGRARRRRAAGRGVGAPVVAWLTHVKRAELARHDQADDKDAWQAREYFSRF
jgi:glutamine synthetase